MSYQIPPNGLVAGKLPRDDYANLQELLEAFAAALSIPSPSSAQVVSAQKSASGMTPVTTKRLLTAGDTSVNVGVNLSGAIVHLVRPSAAPAVGIKGISGGDYSTVNFTGAIVGDDTYLAYTIYK